MRRNYLTMTLAALVLIAGSLAPGATAETQGWRVDGPHTEVNFSVKHFFTPVNGSFEDFDIDLQYDPDHPDKSKVSAKIKVASISTGNERRDNHLRSDDWFSADEHPYITFESTRIRKAANDRLLADGTLTIKGHAQPVTLEIGLLGTRQIPEQMREMLGGAKQVASFEADTWIDRGDYDVGVGSWAGDMVVGKEIGITILLEAHEVG